MNLAPGDLPIAVPSRSLAWQPLDMPYAGVSGRHREPSRAAGGGLPDAKQRARPRRRCCARAAEPGFFLGLDWSDSNFYFNNDWTGYGARASATC
jgi:hypothetical protein